jgi:hypothetical protein
VQYGRHGEFPACAADDRALVETLLDEAAGAGVEMALLFSQTAGGAKRSDFQAMPLTNLTLAVTQSRRGAPMTTVRGGEERDLVAMGRVRAGVQRLQLDRDVDFLLCSIVHRSLREPRRSVRSMFKELRIRLAVVWVAAVVVIAACSVAYGIAFTASTAVVWLMAVLIPPGVMLLVWPSAPPVTIAELLHAVDGPVKERAER